MVRSQGPSGFGITKIFIDFHIQVILIFVEYNFDKKIIGFIIYCHIRLCRDWFHAWAACNAGLGSLPSRPEATSGGIVAWVYTRRRNYSHGRFAMVMLVADWPMVNRK